MMYFLGLIHSEWQETSKSWKRSRLIRALKLTKNRLPGIRDGVEDIRDRLGEERARVLFNEFDELIWDMRQLHLSTLRRRVNRESGVIYCPLHRHILLIMRMRENATAYIYDDGRVVEREEDILPFLDYYTRAFDLLLKDLDEMVSSRLLALCKNPANPYDEAEDTPMQASRA